jgi:hypothetical protein
MHFSTLANTLRLSVDSPVSTLRTERRMLLRVDPFGFAQGTALRGVSLTSPERRGLTLSDGSNVYLGCPEH